MIVGLYRLLKVLYYLMAMTLIFKMTEARHSFMLEFNFALQYFTFNSRGELRSEDNCVDYNGHDLYLRECDNLGLNQKWVYKVGAMIFFR